MGTKFMNEESSHCMQSNSWEVKLLKEYPPKQKERAPMGMLSHRIELAATERKNESLL